MTRTPEESNEASVGSEHVSDEQSVGKKTDFSTVFSEAVGRDVESRIEDLPITQIKTRVAAWVTYMLLLLFGVQVLWFSLTFVALVLWDYSAEDDKQRADLILEGAQVLIPMTSTLLGVAVGYYFRDVLQDRKD